MIVFFSIHIKYHSLFSFCCLRFHMPSRSSQHFCKFSQYLKWYKCDFFINTQKCYKRDKKSRKIRESRFLEVYIHAALALVLSSSLSTEHHKAGAGEWSILGDRNKRGWQLNKKVKQHYSMMHIVHPVSLSFVFVQSTTYDLIFAISLNCRFMDLNLLLIRFVKLWRLFTLKKYYLNNIVIILIFLSLLRKETF